MAFNRSGWKENKSFHEQLSNENQSAEAPTSKFGLFFFFFITDEQAVVVSSPLVVSRSSELRDGCQDFGESSRILQKILQNVYTAVDSLSLAAFFFFATWQRAYGFKNNTLPPTCRSPRKE